VRPLFPIAVDIIGGPVLYDIFDNQDFTTERRGFLQCIYFEKVNIIACVPFLLLFDDALHKVDAEVLNPRRNPNSSHQFPVSAPEATTMR
jgi:hypothetical protein